MGSLSHLTVGTARIPSKPPRSSAPCVEPYVTGSNILKDPGFELQLATYTGGPQGDEMPKLNDAQTAWVWGSDESSYIGETHWVHDTDNNAGERWAIVDTDPRSGTYHAEVLWDDSGGGSVPGNELPLFPVLQKMCVTPSGWNDGLAFYSARIAPGDFIELTGYIKVDTTGQTPTATTTIDLYDSAGTWTATFEPSFAAVTTSYVQFSTSGFAPATTYYALCYFKVQTSSTGTTRFRIDDCTLEVT